MSAATEEFFDALAHRGRERLLRKTNGSIRFDLEHDHGIDHWLVSITNGEVRVSREERPADVEIRTDRAFFERMARGEANPLTAWLRNDIVTEGHFRFIVMLERLFAPPVAHHPRAFAREHRGEK